MAEKMLDLRVSAALLSSPLAMDLDGLRAIVGQKYTDGELRASLIRIGAYHVDDTPAGEPRFTVAA
jgi:hypothetical protein